MCALDWKREREKNQNQNIFIKKLNGYDDDAEGTNN